MFIVVCNNTVVSKLVYDWNFGEEVAIDGEVVAHKPGNLKLPSNVVEGMNPPGPTSAVRRHISG